MLVLNICKKYCPDKLPLNLSNKLGDGADGEVFELHDSNKVIKLGVLYEQDNANIKKQYSSIVKALEYIKAIAPPEYGRVHEHEYLGEFERPVFGNNTHQKYILYYYIMEKLDKLSDDEKKVFHSILSHEDQNLQKSFNLLKVSSMLDGMSKGLDFNKEKVMSFYEKVMNSSINHNDLHPRNIMKDKNGSYKLIDFDRCTVK